MKLKPTNLNIRTSQAEKDMLEQVAQANETTPSEMMRQLIRDAYAQLGKGKEMNTKVQQTQQDIAKARGGCIAVRVYDVNNSGNIEAEIDPAAAKYCPCEFCKAGDLTTSA